MWLPFYERLSRVLSTSIAPEHPGFGDTEFPEWLDGFDDLVLHYRDFLDVLELDPVHLVGFSLGGWIAADLAIFYPERLQSLTLITPAGLHVPEAPMADLFAMPPEEIPDLLFNGNFMPYLDYLPNPEILDEIVHGVRGDGNVRAARHGRRATTRSSSGGCQAVKVPTLVVGAEDDWLSRTCTADRWAEIVPGARLERDPGNRPRSARCRSRTTTAELILGFIEGVEPVNKLQFYSLMFMPYPFIPPGGGAAVDLGRSLRTPTTTRRSGTGSTRSTWS